MTNVASSEWESMGYQPVGYVRNKIIARYLRTQRKNMRRFFLEHGFFKLADRMNQIRNSRQGMLAKNRMFQQVLNEYAKLTNPSQEPVSTPIGAPGFTADPGSGVTVETPDQ